jgi:ABC-type glycerol-3-phosphate transport system permease component
VTPNLPRGSAPWTLRFRSGSASRSFRRYISNQNSYPLSLGLDLILGDYTTNWSWVMAGATAATVPIVILFFLTQRTFVQGITLTGTKG